MKNHPKAPKVELLPEGRSLKLKLRREPLCKLTPAALTRAQGGFSINISICTGISCGCTRAE